MAMPTTEDGMKQTSLNAFFEVLRLWEHEIKEMTAEDLKRKLEEVAHVALGRLNDNP